MLQNMITILTSPTNINLAGFRLEGPAILIIPALIAFLLVAICSIFWIYRDAAQRDKNGFVAILFILLAGWPLSFIWWIWLRPSIVYREINTAEQDAAANP